MRQLPHANADLHGGRRTARSRDPRPDLSIGLATPNACNNCHTEHTAQWAADQVIAWYGQNRRAEPHFGSTIDAAQKEQPGADASLTRLILGSQEPAIVRGTALSLLPNYAANTGPDQVKAYRSGLQDVDPLLRMAAVDTLAFLPPDQRVAVIAPLLNDPVKAVRIAAARSLAAVPTDRLSPEQRSAFDRAAAELIAAEQASAERPEAQISIGAFEAERGHIDQAEAAYRAALRIDPKSAPAMMNLADLYRSMGDETKAESLLREAIAAQPSYAPAYHALGLLLVRLHNADVL
jgi:tetratricopeptide (TPR) repeat protein